MPAPQGAAELLRANVDAATRIYLGGERDINVDQTTGGGAIRVKGSRDMPRWRPLRSRRPAAQRRLALLANSADAATCFCHASSLHRAPRAPPSGAFLAYVLPLRRRKSPVLDDWKSGDAAVL